MEQLLLSDYLIACINFEKDPKEENEKVIQDFLNKLSIKGYIGHKEKEMNMMTTLTTLPEEYDAVATAGQYNISKIVYGLFPYATNLINDVSLATLTFYAVDCFYNYGLVDAILQYCEKDYRRWEKMVDDSLRFDGIFKMLSTLSLLDSTEYDKWMEMMKDLKQEFTPEMMKALSNLAVEGSGSIEDLKKEIAEAALEHAQEQLKEKRQQAAKLEEKIQEIHDKQEEVSAEENPEDKKDA